LSYTLADLQTAIQDDLKDTSFNATRITRYLNYGQNAIFNTHMFKFCEKSVVGTLTIGASTFAQQSDHQATIGGVLYNATSPSNYLLLDDSNYLPHREFFSRYPIATTQTNGMPSSWTEFGKQLYFDRPVDVAYALKQRYFRTPTSLSGPTDVPDVPEAFRELLELYAIYRSEKYRGNHDFAATYKQDFEDGLEAMAMRYSEVQQVAPVVIPSARFRVENL
jgi:hypothetical protein